MSDLISYTLNEIAEFSKGISYSSSDYTENGTGITFITIKSILKGGGYDKTGLKTIRNRFTQQDLLSEDDLLIAITDLTRDGDIVGSPIIIPKHLVGSVASMDLVRIILNESITCTRYLYYFLMLPSTRRYFVNHSSGSTVLHLETKSIPKLTIPLLSLDDQKRVVKILSTVDEVIEKTEAAIDKYQAIKAGMMQDLFTRGIDTQTGKLRPTIEEAPELYKESELGWIPKEWEVNSLKEVSAIEYGASPKSITSNDITNIPIFGSSGNLGYATQSLFNAPLIVVARKGTLNKPTLSNTACWVIDTAYAITPASRINCTWLYYQLDAYDLRRLNESTGVPSISRDYLSRIKLKKPEDTIEQDKIANILMDIDNHILSETISRNKYQSIKQGLMADLLTGKVRVNLKENKVENR